jgi:hypothetical protein
LAELLGDCLRCPTAPSDEENRPAASRRQRDLSSCAVAATNGDQDDRVIECDTPRDLHHRWSFVAPRCSGRSKKPMMGLGAGSVLIVGVTAEAQQLTVRSDAEQRAVRRVCRKGRAQLSHQSYICTSRDNYALHLPAERSQRLLQEEPQLVVLILTEFLLGGSGDDQNCAVAWNPKLINCLVNWLVARVEY